jgi:short subunit dehydrogenase-like uncharacterized protein
VLPTAARRLLSAGRYAGRLLKSYPVQRMLKLLVRRQPPGPSDEQRARGFSLIWGKLLYSAGARCSARQRGPEAYTLTALTALAIVEKVLAGELSIGFQTPSRAYGADFILEIPGVTREDIE